MGIADVAGILVRVYKEAGVLGIVDRVCLKLVFMFKGADFSNSHLDLSSPAANVENGHHHSATSKHLVEKCAKIIEKHDREIYEGTFVDYGSGKGLTLYAACKLRFSAAVGVEFMEGFCRICERNLDKLLTPAERARVRIINEDASLVAPPADTKVIFFHNPFNAVVMKEVIDNILSTPFKGDVFIVYNNAVLRDLFLVAHGSDFRLLYRDEKFNVDIYRLPRVG